ncbi:hypothetical protein ISN44_As06g045060 [Arabidopsis suecica]|uniref:Uncharacterized protein n=1 Tax=Arabidopsis suecica TaxID=45249 RepID=A0A8T2CPU9_ARASU|nr:hypothetical protein ISN44_As06g045060 [Arabidopsis suecica]
MKHMRHPLVSTHESDPSSPSSPVNRTTAITVQLRYSQTSLLVLVTSSITSPVRFKASPPTSSSENPRLFRRAPLPLRRAPSCSVTSDPQLHLESKSLTVIPGAYSVQCRYRSYLELCRLSGDVEEIVADLKVMSSALPSYCDLSPVAGHQKFLHT